jgi:hypothetical protein
VAHGYLHSVVPRLPLWLDEGLAEYFEVPRGLDGVNRAHVVALTAESEKGWRPNLERLEHLLTTAELQQGDYAESWAWVHFLLDKPERRQILQVYLRGLGKPQSLEPLSVQVRRAVPQADKQLVEHVQVLNQALR